MLQNRYKNPHHVFYSVHINIYVCTYTCKYFIYEASFEKNPTENFYVGTK